MARIMSQEVNAIAGVILAFCSLTLQIIALVALSLLTFFHNIALTLIPWLITFTTGQAENTNLLLQTVAGLPEGTIQTPYLFVVSSGKPTANDCSPNYKHILSQIKHGQEHSAHKMTPSTDIASAMEQSVTNSVPRKHEVRFSPNISYSGT